MSEAIKTKVTLGSWATSVQALIEAQHIDSKALTNAVNSALGELKADGATKTDGKAKVKVSKTDDQSDSFTLKQKEVTNFTGVLVPGLAVFYFNQEIMRLEKAIGEFELADWPMQIRGWIFKKFGPKIETPVS